MHGGVIGAMGHGLLAGLLALSLGGAAAAREAAPGPAEEGLGERVWVRPLRDGVWVVRSISPLPGFGDVESNALLLAGPSAAVLVDTPATDGQTERVLAWAERSLRRPVRQLIVTHWHRDRMGGLAAAQTRGVEAYALERTRAIARAKGLPVPQHGLGDDARLTLSGLALETHWPGPGHTEDNLVVWLPGPRVLDGGCFVKAAAAKALGNLAEIDPAGWAKGTAELQRRYAAARWVIPGHGRPGGPELLAHTAALLAAHGR